MPITVGKSGVHKNMTAGGVGQGGSWKPIAGIWVGSGGVWKSAFTGDLPWNPPYITGGTAALRVDLGGVLGYAVGTPGTFGSLAAPSFLYTGSNGHYGLKTILAAYVTTLFQVVIRIDGFSSAPAAGWLTSAVLQLGSGTYTVFPGAPTFSDGVATWTAIGSTSGSPSAGVLNLTLNIP
jgi:hypothetical protein